MSKKPAALPIFGDAYLADTMHLSLEEHGAYFLMMLAAWRSSNCALPDDDVKLARICRCTPKRFKAIKSTIFEMWELTEHGWTQKRLSKEFAYVDDKRRSQAQKADARWGRDEDDDRHPRDGARLRAERLSEARKLGRHTKEQWEALLEAVGHQCVRCTATGAELVRDHIKPIYQGGSDAISNIQPLCNKCNSSKGNNSTDFRLSVCKDLFERLPECLPNEENSPAPPPPPIEEPNGSLSEASPPLREHLPTAVAVDVWNMTGTLKGWPSIQKLSDARRKLLSDRLRKDGGIDGWRAALSRAAASPYLGGSPPPNWFTFDWLIKAGNFLKVVEGNYDRTRNNGSTSPGAGTGYGRTTEAALRVLADSESRQASAAGFEGGGTTRIGGSQRETVPGH